MIDPIKSNETQTKPTPVVADTKPVEANKG